MGVSTLAASDLRDREREFSGPPRHLREDEVLFIDNILCIGGCRNIFPEKLEDMLVRDMSDGGMGGLYFLSSDDHIRVLGSVLVESEFVDDDGVLVIAAINLDSQGVPYELDIWKVDYSPLCNFPDKRKIRIISHKKNDA